MFALIDDVKRPAPPRAGLHWLWAVGLALSAISNLLHSQHQRLGLRFACSVTGLIFMIAGVALTLVARRRSA